MENTALLLIGIAILLLIIVIILISLLFYKMLKDKGQASTSQPQDNTSHYHPEILNRMKSIQKVVKAPSLFCPNHSEEPGEVMCAICDKLFCRSCIKPFKTFHLCKEHLPLLMKYEWDEVLTLKTSTEDPEKGVRLYDLKKELFNDKHHSTYIETHYKINVDNDYIETYLVLFAIKDELSMVKEFLDNKL